MTQIPEGFTDLVLSAKQSQEQTQGWHSPSKFYLFLAWR